MSSSSEEARNFYNADDEKLANLYEVGEQCLPLFLPNLAGRLSAAQCDELAELFLEHFDDEHLLISPQVALAANFKAVYHEENGHPDSKHFLYWLEDALSDDYNHYGDLALADGVLSMVIFAITIRHGKGKDFPLHDFRNMTYTEVTRSEYKTNLIRNLGSIPNVSAGNTELPMTATLRCIEPALRVRVATWPDYSNIQHGVDEVGYRAYYVAMQMLQTVIPSSEGGGREPVGPAEFGPNPIANPFITQITFAEPRSPESY